MTTTMTYLSTELCPICIENDVTCITECGHSYCITCLCKIKKCALCRKDLIRHQLCKEIIGKYKKCNPRFIDPNTMSISYINLRALMLMSRIPGLTYSNL
jgi:hypothetical protein